MEYEEARRLMRREIIPHKTGTAPKNRESLNRMNEVARSVKDPQAQKELAREFTSKRR